MSPPTFPSRTIALEPEWANAGVDKDGKRTCGPAAFLADTNNLTAWRADRGVGRRNADSVAVAQFEKPLTLPAGHQVEILPAPGPCAVPAATRRTP